MLSTVICAPAVLFYGFIRDTILNRQHKRKTSVSQSPISGSTRVNTYTAKINMAALNLLVTVELLALLGFVFVCVRTYVLIL